MSEPKHNQSMVERIEDELRRRAILRVVAAVGSGNYAIRLRNDLPETNPLSALYQGINQMIESLEKQRQRSAAYQQELEDKLATIELQRATIRELSTPIIELWEGVLCLPVVGVVDSTRSAEMTEALLHAIVAKKARCAIIDVTGIEVMDTGTVDHFLRMTRAVRLLGSNCLLTGIHPAIAQTMVHMGIDLGGVVSHRTMRSALQQYVERQSTIDDDRHRARETTRR